jgi:hypothetical protein
LEVLSIKTGTPIERVRKTTLAAYENILYERHNTLGPTSWIMPVGVYHRTRKQFGLQYCPLCLAEDEEPFFRCKWRLAFIVSCERHQTLLHDRCPRCGAAVNFHRDELGTPHKFVVDLLTLCHVCRFDLRTIDNRFTTHVTNTESEFTTLLLRAMDAGYVQLSESVRTYSHLFFAGLRQLMKIAAMRNNRIENLRRAISEARGLGIYSPSAIGSQPDVQEMSIEARRQLLWIACQLLEEWPFRFVELSRKYKVWSSLWLRHLDPPARAHTLPAPFWLWAVVHEHLYRARYCPSDEEIKAAIRHLRMKRKIVNKSTVARLLGIAVVRRNTD